MTEAEWNGCEDPHAMLRFLRDSGKASERKLRLFACACCRRIERLLSEQGRGALRICERLVDGRADEFDRAKVKMLHLAGAADAATRAAAGRTVETFWAAAALAMTAVEGQAGKAQERAQQCRLLRDIFGPLPFRSVPLEEAWLRWNDGCVVKLATASYETRRFEEMPILADALEEAGCANLDLLEHCRSAGEHVRGCWALDALLGKS